MDNRSQTKYLKIAGQTQKKKKRKFHKIHQNEVVEKVWPEMTDTGSKK